MTVPVRGVGGCGIGFRPLIAPVSPSAISGMPIKRSSAPSPPTISRSARRLDSPITLNAGITPYANAWVASFANRSLFPNPTSFTILLSNFSSTTTTVLYLYQSLLSHYPNPHPNYCPTRPWGFIIHHPSEMDWDDGDATDPIPTATDSPKCNDDTPHIDVRVE